MTDECREAFEEWYSKQETLSSIKPASWRAFQAGRASSPVTDEMVEAAAKALWDSSPSHCEMSWAECASITPAEAEKARNLAAIMLQAALRGRG
jgi:hypothetical protein